jgi:hypothetical protein
MTEEMTALAARQLERVKALCSQIGLKYLELPTQFVGVGIAIGFGEMDYTILSIMAGGSETHLMATSGILKDINRDRVAALRIVNRFNQQNTAYTVYLHDAEACWSLLVQHTAPIEVFLAVPSYLNAMVRGLPMAVQEFRQQLTQEAELGGQPWSWTERDHSDLLLKSML